jgi:riboflavin synthase
MFTGIIEDKGKILSITRGRARKISIQSVLENRTGDSIAVSGVCLTVTGLIKGGFTIEAVAQTRGSTTLDRWKIGDGVNLERALKLGDRLGGHMVLGHVDETAKLVRVAGNEYYFQSGLKHQKYLIPKGSVCVDGISLTIGKVSQNIFSVSLIPHTLENTTFPRLKPGAFVNVEYDYLVKINIK